MREDMKLYIEEAGIKKESDSTFNPFTYCEIITGWYDFERSLYLQSQNLNGCYNWLRYTLERVMKRFTTEEISFLLDSTFCIVINPHSNVGEYHGLLFRRIEERIQYEKNKSLGNGLLIKLKDLTSLEELTLINFIDRFWFGNVCPSLEKYVDHYFANV